MAQKFYTVEKEINGVNYKAQFNGISAALEAQEGFFIDGTSTPSSAKIANYILKHVIVEPKGLTPDDFRRMDDLADVVAWGRDVMEGNFCPDEEDKGKAK